MSRKFMSVALSTLMLGSIVIAGCSSNKTSSDTGDKQPSPSAGNASANSYPMKPVTLKVWAPLHPNASKYIKDFSENEAYAEMEKRTGVHIQWTHPTVGQEKEGFNLMIASGDLPDIIITADKYKGGVAAGVKDGVFEDLTPYMQKYAPDYYKLVNSNAEIKREVTTDEGKYDAFYTIKPE